MFKSCWWTPAKEPDLHHELYRVTEKFKIAVLPIAFNECIDNLNDSLATWSVYVVGKDLIFIQATDLPGMHDIDLCFLVNKSVSDMPSELQHIFRPIWMNTLSGKYIQTYFVMSGILYELYTHPLFNQKQSIIGACMFVRKAEFINIPGMTKVDPWKLTNPDPYTYTSDLM
jgi:hypothetical protein